LEVLPNCSLLVCRAFTMFVLPSKIEPALRKRSAMTPSRSGIRSLARVPTEAPSPSVSCMSFSVNGTP
jgi:hypothetical protein